MIISCGNSGSLADRLWGYAALIDTSIKYNIRVFIPDFAHYAMYFENLNRLPKVHFEINENSKIDGVLRKNYIEFLSILKKTPEAATPLKYIFADSTMSINELVDKARNNNVCVDAWGYFQNKKINYTQSHQKIKSIFAANSKVIKTIQPTIEELKKKFDMIIGVQSPVSSKQAAIYKNTDLKHILTQLVEKNPDFTICFISDSTILQCTDKLHIIHITKQTPIDYMYIYKNCDYILSFPSTYTMWSSFYEKRPLYMLKVNDVEAYFKNFKIIGRQNYNIDNTYSL